jgi:hypothetical protein
MFAEQIAGAIERAHPSKLPQLSTALWKAWGGGLIPDGEAERLAGLIEARKAVAKPATLARGARSGSRPRTAASMERRRSWAACGRLPPRLACQFTLGEVAALSVVAAEVLKHGACGLTVAHIAAVAGVGLTTVRNALRHAKRLGLVTVEERKRTAWMNYPNLVRIVSPEWASWLRLHGFKSAKPTPTKDSRRAEKKGFRGEVSAGTALRGEILRACADRERATRPAVTPER